MDKPLLWLDVLRIFSCLGAECAVDNSNVLLALKFKELECRC